MRLYAATAGEDKPESGSPGLRLSSPKRSSSCSWASDIAALLAAAALLGIMLWSHGSGLLQSRNYLYFLLGLTFSFAVAARLVRGVSTSGALAGAAVAFMMAGRDLGLFWVLLVLFFVTFAATRVGASRKLLLRVAEAESGRSASQVMANLGVAALALAIPKLGSGYLLSLAALAEAAADTTSSEIGAAFSGKTLLITTWKSVPVGTNGGISVVGTVAGAVASLLVASAAALFDLTSLSGGLLVTCAGIGGMLADSFLGATLEPRGYLNNDAVNLLSTGGAAVGSWLLAYLCGCGAIT